MAWLRGFHITLAYTTPFICFVSMVLCLCLSLFPFFISLFGWLVLFSLFCLFVGWSVYLFVFLLVWFFLSVLVFVIVCLFVCSYVRSFACSFLGACVHLSCARSTVGDHNWKNQGDHSKAFI